ncbi:hypothetical protein ACTXT7_008939 [Hymenolepis weldensis]
MENTCVKCDACDTNGFRLRRYKCLKCIDFDLCGTCFDTGEETNKHHSHHPMQCIILESDHKLFFPESKPSEISRSYTCPVCGATGFRVADLKYHVELRHPGTHHAVLCPLCAYPSPEFFISSGCNPNRPHKDFLNHLQSVHRPKKSSPPNSSQGQEVNNNNNNSSSVEASLNRDEDFYYKPEGDEKISGLCKFDKLLTPEEQVIDDLISRSSFSSQDFGLNILFRLKKMDASSLNNAQISQTSSDMIPDHIAFETRKEKNNITMSSQLSEDIGNHNNADDQDDQDVDTDNSDMELDDDSTSEAVAAARDLAESGRVVNDNVDDSDSVILVSAAQKTDTDKADKESDTVDQDWVTYVQELIWDSLNLKSLSLTIDGH